MKAKPTSDKTEEIPPIDYAQALNLIGSLSKPSKMPAWSWSISAQDCITGSKLREIEGSTCSECYALRGRYLFNNVTAAHARRRAALDHPQFVEAFVIVLTRLYANMRRDEDRFRWFDSGDLPNLEALEKIVTIAEATPQIQHWLPTRELQIVRRLSRPIPANLTIRLSAPMVGQSITPLPGTTWSGVDVPGIDQCPAPQQNNQCGDCRLCWGDKPVSYALH